MKVCTSIGVDGEDMVGKMIPKPIHEYSQEDTEHYKKTGQNRPHKTDRHK